ncbi:DUF3726 domain-containing protein [Thioclava sp. FR2]|uniref:DUF3726 domain-containing protein n=1 Tax=Thioclava sp. FR2 TaxID=3445780 RepID=UPI003EB872CD
MTDPKTRVILSRNETEALAAKAARGAGLPWGVAEEAGFAAGWLHSAGLDGLSPLLAHLGQVEISGWHQMRPRWSLGGWDNENAKVPLCPIALGMTLSDFAASSDSEKGFSQRLSIAGKVAFPVLVLPFLSTIIPPQLEALKVDLNDVSLTLGNEYIHAGEPLDAAKLLTVEQSPLRLAQASAPYPSRSNQCVATPAETLAGLERLALQTTVPPSLQSRADAGAGGSDND